MILLAEGASILLAKTGTEYSSRLLSVLFDALSAPG
jgi:hypothetical protein